MTVNQMMINLKRLNVPDEIRKALTEIQPVMEQLNVQQMEKGKDSKGQPITYEGRTTYSQRTTERKGRSSPIDLKDTGDFHRGIESFVGRDAIFFDSSDPKSGLLQQKSGEVIFGLNEESLPKARKAGEAVLLINIKEKLQL